MDIQGEAKPKVQRPRRRERRIFTLSGSLLPEYDHAVVLHRDRQLGHGFAVEVADPDCQRHFAAADPQEHVAAFVVGHNPVRFAGPNLDKIGKLGVVPKKPGS